jgi:hypothetical protein
VAWWFIKKTIAVISQFWCHNIQQNHIYLEWKMSNGRSKSGSVVHTKKSKLWRQHFGAATFVKVTSTWNEKHLIDAQKVIWWFTQKTIAVISQFWCQDIQQNDIYLEWKRLNECSKRAQRFTLKIKVAKSKFWSCHNYPSNIYKEWKMYNGGSESSSVVHSKNHSCDITVLVP